MGKSYYAVRNRYVLRCLFFVNLITRNYESTTVQLFFRRLLSKTKPKEYNGITSIKNKDNPYVQLFTLWDFPDLIEFEVEFTEDEVHSNETFCKKIYKYMVSIVFLSLKRRFYNMI